MKLFLTGLLLSSFAIAEVNCKKPTTIPLDSGILECKAVVSKSVEGQWGLQVLQEKIIELPRPGEFFRPQEIIKINDGYSKPQLEYKITVDDLNHSCIGRKGRGKNKTILSEAQMKVTWKNTISESSETNIGLFRFNSSAPSDVYRSSSIFPLHSTSSLYLEIICSENR